MSERATHKFQFSAQAIAQAASAEAEYHEQRVRHWEERGEAALAIVKGTIGAKVVEHEITGGKTLSVDVDFGDQSAWNEAKLAYSKAQGHRDAAQRFRTDAQVYGTQGERAYELDTDDVHHFRLGGQPRED